MSTPSGDIRDIKCPRGTTSLSGAADVKSCRISEINVCDKIRIDPTDPYIDVSYLAEYKYTTLDESASLSYDSSVNAASPTGEIRVMNKIQITNESASSPYWLNDTIEAFRSCPQYGSGSPSTQYVLSSESCLPF